MKKIFTIKRYYSNPRGLNAVVGVGEHQEMVHIPAKEYQEWADENNAFSFQFIQSGKADMNTVEAYLKDYIITCLADHVKILNEAIEEGIRDYSSE